MRKRHAFLSSWVIAAAFLLSCGGAPAPSDAASAASAELRNAGGSKLVTVMTRNLYLGAELGPAIQAPDQDTFLAATTAIWAMVQKNDFHIRAQGIADEIAAAHPDLVGLQEAYTWKYAATPGGEETVVYDYVPDLVAALAERGLVYRPVATVELSDIMAPIIASLDPFALGYIHMTDHGVILARRGGVQTRNAQGHVYAEENLLPITIMGQASFVKRGWVSVEVKHQGEWFTLVSTHLEAYTWYYRWLQAQELAAAVGDLRGRVLLVGDLNSDPLDARTVDGYPGANTYAYQTLVGSGLDDAWLQVHPGEPGLTSPYHEDLTIESITLDERIDHVLYRGHLAPCAEAVVGTAPSDRVCGVNRLGVSECLWPSDHAGLWATFQLEGRKHCHGAH